MLYVFRYCMLCKYVPLAVPTGQLAPFFCACDDAGRPSCATSRSSLLSCSGETLVDALRAVEFDEFCLAHNTGLPAGTMNPLPT